MPCIRIEGDWHAGRARAHQAILIALKIQTTPRLTAVMGVSLRGLMSARDSLKTLHEDSKLHALRASVAIDMIT